jgi:hypothetical protein
MTSPTVPPNVLFFSKKCKTCNIFMSLCQQNKLLKFFKLIDVDDKIKQLTEQGLKLVPTIIVKGLNKPIEGKNVFNWLDSILALNNNKNFDLNNEPIIHNPIKQPNVINPNNGSGSTNSNNNVVKRTIITPPIINNQNQSQNNNNVRPSVKIVNGVEINNNNPCVKKELLSFTQDEMTGFSDTFAYLQTDQPLPKSFLSYDNDNVEIYTAPEGEKPNEKYLEKLMKTVEMIRDNDKKTFVKNMEDEHTKILLTHNKN